MAAKLQLMAALLLLTPLAQSQGGGEGEAIRFGNSIDEAADIGGLLDMFDGNVEDIDMATLRALNNANTMEEWALMMGVDVPADEEPAQNNTLLLRSGGPDPSTAIKAVKAGCAVEIRTVELTLPSGGGKMYFPTCVRLPRCAGCCLNPKLLQCRPTKVNRIFLKIMDINLTPASLVTRNPGYRGGRGHSGRGRSAALRYAASGRSSSSRRRKRSTNFHIVEEEEHVTCACLCRVQETDCDPAIQTYDKTNCQCACNNKDEMNKCQGLSTHFWEKSTCKCRCNRETTCSHSQYYDQTSCTCMNLMLRMGDSSGRSGAIPGMMNFNSTHHYVPVAMPDQ